MEAISINGNSEAEKLAAEKLLTFIRTLCQMDDHKWKELETLVNEVQNNFVVKLRLSYHSLSEDDIHIILLLRIGLNHTQIAKVTNVQKSSFRIRRCRLKKKMGIECGSISDFIRELNFD